MGVSPGAEESFTRSPPHIFPWKVGKAEQRLAKAQAGDGTFGTFDEDDLAIELSATEERLAALRQIEADVAALGKKGKVPASA